MSPEQIDAPIVAVTVYPDRARVTRCGGVRLAGGEHKIRIGPLPSGLHRDSLRVGGRGPATVLGVDVRTRHEARTTAPAAARLQGRRRELAAELAGLDDAHAVEEQRAGFLGLLTERAGGAYARALAGGDAAATDVTGFADAISEQLLRIRARQRELRTRQDELRDELAAVDRELAELAGQRVPDLLFAELSILVGDAADQTGDGTAEVELELSYVVGGAGWQTSYDIRLIEQELTLTWLALITQQTGEDWPEAELLLSTARPATAAVVPELEPWYLDRLRPTPIALMAAAPAAAPGPPKRAAAMGSGAARFGAAEQAPVAVQTATVEQGVAAATYRPARPVAVPADGSAHRATVAVLTLPVRLDHVTAPVRSAEVHLRAKVSNASVHTLLPGPASVFHGGDFVGGTRLPVWAPGEEVELALGVDDRVRAERKLTRRSDTRATLGSTRRREVAYQITVANHTPRATRVTVLDQLPVSRDEGITIRELGLDPAPSTRSELGELAWQLELPPGGSSRVELGWRVELAKGVELAGWRD